MRILAIDPGTTESGIVTLLNGQTTDAAVMPNHEVIDFIQKSELFDIDVLAIEMVASYGMAVGKEVFETVRWVGRFQQAWRAPDEVRLAYRRDVKLHLCGNAKAKDANIRQALIDLLGPQGTKKAPGPTYGVKSHAWAALAVAVTVAGITPESLRGAA